MQTPLRVSIPSSHSPAVTYVKWLCAAQFSRVCKDARLGHRHCAACACRHGSAIASNCCSICNDEDLDAGAELADVTWNETDKGRTPGW